MVKGREVDRRLLLYAVPLWYSSLFNAVGGHGSIICWSSNIYRVMFIHNFSFFYLHYWRLLTDKTSA